jgi:4-amino-4-deoxy-L-arabinose transferase-like glycosyltransferase
VPGLQSIDIAVFRFINETMQSPLLDKLMPIFAGGPWFLPLLFIGGTAMIWRGGSRGRMFVLLLALVLVMGDGWITKRLKHAIGRPRPCLTLTNVNLPMVLENPREDDENQFHRGCSSSGSMPSGHTTNWFSAAMVAWIFYRRTWRFMLPLACLVGLSRIYTGVHYPSDVLAGAIVGAGYACAIVIGANALWQAIARRWFPLWAEVLPSLLPIPPHSTVPLPRATQHVPSVDAHWLRLGYIVIAAVLVGRLIYIQWGKIELSEDEAYQWLWSRHLALSYYSKPPLIAYVQWLGTRLFGDTEFGIRFFSPLCAAIGSFVALRFFAKHGKARAGFWLVAIVNVTPLLAIGSTLMTVDPLLVLFWTLAMFAGWRAAQPDGQTKHWAMVGLWMGLAFLSKYTALLQWLCWAVFFVLWKPARVHLRRPGLYVALLVNVVCALPVIIWNAPHHWITTTHVASNANLDEGWQFDWRQPLEFLGGTAGLLHPMFFVATVWAAVAIWKSEKASKTEVSSPAEPAHVQDDAGLLRYFFAMGAPLFLVYALYTLHSRVQLNWIAASIIPLFCVMVLYWDRRYQQGTRHMRALLTMAMLLGAFAVTLIHETDLVKKISSVYLPAKMDPLRRVRGWTQMANITTRERRKLLDEGKPVFVIGGHYGTAGLLSFYMPEARAVVNSTPLVYYRDTGKPNTQFYFWPSYIGVRQGENALFVQERDKPAPVPPAVAKQFASVTEVGRFSILHRHRVLHCIQVFACRDLQH